MAEVLRSAALASYVAAFPAPQLLAGRQPGPGPVKGRGSRVVLELVGGHLFASRLTRVHAIITIVFPVIVCHYTTHFELSEESNSIQEYPRESKRVQ